MVKQYVSRYNEDSQKETIQKFETYYDSGLYFLIELLDDAKPTVTKDRNQMIYGFKYKAAAYGVEEVSFKFGDTFNVILEIKNNKLHMSVDEKVLSI